MFMKDVLRKGEDENLGIAGYRKFMGNDKYENAIGLLDGVVGIGVVLIDSLMKENQKIEWDRESGLSLRFRGS